MKVPVLDLRDQYSGLKKDFMTSFERLFDSGAFILGPDVEKLEAELGQYLGAKHTIGVSSGTDALWLSLKALGVGPGDKVLTSPFTFFATVSSILSAGAEPVFVDIDPATFNLDPAKTEEALSADKQRKIKAIVPVHLYGQPAEMEAFQRLAEKFQCGLIEDAAQAIGSEYHGKRTGTLGNLCCFSFFPTKNLGALGDAGLVSTNDDKLAETVRKLRTHGSKQKYYHEILGSNCRIDTMQAAFLRVMLPHLNGWIEARQKCADYYDKGLARLSEHVEIPRRAPNTVHSFHQYTIRVKQGGRESLKRFLTELEIGTAVYYPVPCHLQKALDRFGFRQGNFPLSERAAEEVLSLPIYPNLSTEKQDLVIQGITKWTTIES